MTDREVHRALGIGNAIRYAAPTGTLLIRWEGARAPTVRTIPPPAVDPFEARLELARRYLHVFGPTDAAAFAEWAGISSRGGRAAFEALAAELLAVRTPLGDRWMLTADEPAMRVAPAAPAPARLLPSGDTFFLLFPPTTVFQLLATPKRGPDIVLPIETRLQVKLMSPIYVETPTKVTAGPAPATTSSTR
jgi:hypothetical protein